MTRLRFPTLILATLAAASFLTSPARAAEIPKLSSPDGKLSVSIQRTNGLTYSIDLDGAPLLIPSKLSLAFEGGLQLVRQSHGFRNLATTCARERQWSL